ncbi:MAG: energy-coupling factor transporter transmembrane component T [Acidobacteriota bacterium]
MRHSFWDHYSSLDSPIHNIPTGIKIFFTISLVVILTVLPGFYISYASLPILILLITILIMSGVPVWNIIKRTLVILPLVLPVIVLNSIFMESGLKHSLILSVRSFLSIFSLILLVSVTRFSDIMKTLSSWHFPRIMIMILSFMYRYFFLLTGEMEKMVRAVKLRSGGIRGVGLIRIYGQVLAILFIKSYERAERVYHAMLMRGYDGNGGL